MTTKECAEESSSPFLFFPRPRPRPPLLSFRPLHHSSMTLPFPSLRQLIWTPSRKDQERRQGSEETRARHETRQEHFHTFNRFRNILLTMPSSPHAEVFRQTSDSAGSIGSISLIFVVRAVWAVWAVRTVRGICPIRTGSVGRVIVPFRRVHCTHCHRGGEAWVGDRNRGTVVGDCDGLVFVHKLRD
jgi:hypothetical protein